MKLCLSVLVCLGDGVSWSISGEIFLLLGVISPDMILPDSVLILVGVLMKVSYNLFLVFCSMISFTLKSSATVSPKASTVLRCGFVLSLGWSLLLSDSSSLLYLKRVCVIRSISFFKWDYLVFLCGEPRTTVCLMHPYVWKLFQT